MNGGIGTTSDAKMKKDAIATTMHSIHRKTNPLSMIPVHAMGEPNSFCLRIRFKEITPNKSAKIPNRKLVGKQIKPVNGKGIVPVQNDRMVKIPNTRLRMA
jgi:hypothetical protein